MRNPQLLALVYLPCAFLGIQFGPFVETHLTINLSSSEHTCQDVPQDETIQVSILVPDVLNNKVNRCLARYSPRATPTNRPTNRAPKKPAWPDPN